MFSCQIIYGYMGDIREVRKVVCDARVPTQRSNSTMLFIFFFCFSFNFYPHFIFMYISFVIIIYQQFTKYIIIHTKQRIVFYNKGISLYQYRVASNTHTHPHTPMHARIPHLHSNYLFYVSNSFKGCQVQYNTCG